MSDADDFAEWVTARSPALLRTAYLLTGNHHDAEDLVQATLIKVVPRWGRLAEPEPYVRKVLAHEWVSRWRRRRWREVLVQAPAERPVDGDQAERLALQQALAGLAPRQRAVVVLRYFDDLTEAQTADALGIAVGTVKSQARDALARLRQLLPDLDTDRV